MTFTRFKLFMWAMVALAIYIVLTLAMPERALIAILNGVALGVVVCVAIVYAPVIWFSVKSGRLDRVSQLTVGIVLLWIATALQRGWSLYSRFHHLDANARDSFVVSFIIYLAIVGGAMFVTAPGYPPADHEGRVELGGTNRKLLLTLGVVGGLTTFILSVYPGVEF